MSFSQGTQYTKTTDEVIINGGFSGELGFAACNLQFGPGPDDDDDELNMGGGRETGSGWGQVKSSEWVLCFFLWGSCYGLFLKFPNVF